MVDLFLTISSDTIDRHTVMFQKIQTGLDVFHFLDI